MPTVLKMTFFKSGSSLLATYATNSTFGAYEHDILNSVWWIFIVLTPMMHYGTDMNAECIKFWHDVEKSQG